MHEKVDAKRFAEHLSQAISIKTISNADRSKVDWNEFKKFHDFLEKEYPLIHNNLKKEVIGQANLMYYWEGADKSLDPICLIGHIDVVPVTSGTEDDWEHPAFDGYNDGEFIWGRGALDMKVHVIGVMEAVETLLEEGFKPVRGVYLCFGENEEIMDLEDSGARQIVEELQRRGVRLDCVIDEGGAMIPINVPVVFSNKVLAGVGLAEKGYADFRITASAKGGHSSAPPVHTALGRISKAITKLERNQFKPVMLPQISDMFGTILSNCCTPINKLGAHMDILGPILLKLLTAVPAGASFVRTTIAVTMAQGSPAANVLPQKASAVINFRLMHGTTIKDVENHIKRVTKDKGLELELVKGREPSAFSPTDSRAYRVIERLCKEIDDGTVVVPYLIVGGTDAYNYYPICDNVYRFSPFAAPTELLLCTHSTNERCPVSALEPGAAFFKGYIRELSSN